jgi:hypothetical protein
MGGDHSSGRFANQYLAIGRKSFLLVNRLGCENRQRLPSFGSSIYRIRRWISSCVGDTADRFER